VTAQLVASGGRGNLTKTDLELFERLGVSADLLERAGVHRVTDAEARRICGFNSQGDNRGIVFPYFDVVSGNRVTARLRLDNPELDSESKPENKYVCPYGDNRHLYFPPGAASLLADPTVPVVFVEAEKSSLAITALMERTQRRYLAVATGGCWSWRGKVGIRATPTGGREEERGPLSDLSLITWDQGRPAIIVFDSNTANNPAVRAARWAFAQCLAAVGGKVFFVDIPPEGGANGPDDLIAIVGDEALLALLDAPKPFGEQAEQDARAAVATLSKSCDLEARDRALDAIARVPDLSHQRVLAERAAKALGERGKKAVELQIGVKATALREARERAKEAVRHGRLLRIKVEPAVLVEELVQYLNQRMYLRPGAALLLALYVLNTWCFDLFETVAYLLVTSPLPECGKSRLLALLNAVCARAREWVSVSGASMFRTIELCKPTLLIDQVEKLAAADESSRDLIAILDAGYKKGARVPRMTGNNHDILIEFSVYCPKVLACVGKPKGALLDRCIVNELERKPRSVKLKSARTKAIARIAEGLRDACEAYAVQQREGLIRLYGEEPDEGYWPTLPDREQELFGPLLLHAHIAGIEKHALEVAQAFSGRKLDIQSQEQDFSLARELCEVLRKFKGERFSSKALLCHLREKESWGNRLAAAKDERAASTSIGRFLARFRLDSRKHEDSGTTYETAEAIKKISSYTPLDAGVRSVSDSLRPAESDGCAADTSRQDEVRGEKGVRSQATEREQVVSQLTPLTPKIEDTEGDWKSGHEISMAQVDEAEQVSCKDTHVEQRSGANGKWKVRGDGVTQGVLRF
jgi:hypothetical protein